MFLEKAKRNNQVTLLKILFKPELGDQLTTLLRLRLSGLLGSGAFRAKIEKSQENWNKLITLKIALLQDGRVP